MVGTCSKSAQCCHLAEARPQNPFLRRNVRLCGVNPRIAVAGSEMVIDNSSQCRGINSSPAGPFHGHAVVYPEFTVCGRNRYVSVSDAMLSRPLDPGKMYQMTVNTNCVTGVSAVEPLEPFAHIESANFGELANILSVYHLPTNAVVARNRCSPPNRLRHAVEICPLDAQPCVAVDCCRDFS
jgi:hypothetical protein